MVPINAFFVLLAANFMLGDAEVFELLYRPIQIGKTFNWSLTLDLHDYALNDITEVNLCQILATRDSSAEVRVTKLISDDPNLQANQTALYAPAGNLTWRVDIFIQNATLEDACLLLCNVNSNNETRRSISFLEIVPPIETVVCYEQVVSLTALVAISFIGLCFLALLGIQLGALRSYTMRKMDEKEGRRNYLFERTTPFEETAHRRNEETAQRRNEETAQRRNEETAHRRNEETDHNRNEETYHRRNEETTST